ncbi:MAG TPA: type I-U CRISPR-associated protein Csb2 [Candidatus Binatia bacterium]|nr:type I-U CRISPR-associated protein Csb2 [Candidatus Binatia bacterium]
MNCFPERIGPDGFTPPPPVTAYDVVTYRRTTDPPPRPIAAFALLRPDADGFRAFDPARRGLTVAGMLRHAARRAADTAGWPDARIRGFVLGHGDADAPGRHVPVGAARFAYLPLASVESRGPGRSLVTGSIRRALLTVFADGTPPEIAWARRALSGQELIEEGRDRAVALLSAIPETDAVVGRYTRPASEWATVTPVVLPGYDDPAHYRRRLRSGADGSPSRQQRELLARLDARIDGLLRKAIRQAGFSPTLAEHALLEWRSVGFWPGTERADRYGVPDHLRRFPRYHVRVGWRDAAGQPLEVPGPICFGGGRFHGVGLFAACHAA